MLGHCKLPVPCLWELTRDKANLGNGYGSQNRKAHVLSVEDATDICTSLELLGHVPHLASSPPKEPGTSTYVDVRRRKAHNEIAAIPSITMVEKRMPPLKKLPDVSARLFEIYCRLTLVP